MDESDSSPRRQPEKRRKLGWYVRVKINKIA
jgi:hypothetical protein